MKVLIIFAHPERTSLNGGLLDVIISELESQGHEVKVSDLYAMRWKSQVDSKDFPGHATEPLSIMSASKAAFDSGTLTEDVMEEMRKLVWADTVIFQFPLWWFSMPAIMKGWVDRVFACGYAYGRGPISDTRWGDRYGEGVMEGKRAMLVVTVGGRVTHYTQRGINGPIDDLLFPITHGQLCYAGFSVLPSHVVYHALRFDDAGFRSIANDLRARIRTLDSTKPIPYRRQNYGDYEMPSLELKPGLEKHGRSGFALHIDE